MAVFIAKPFTSAEDFLSRITLGQTRECLFWDYKAMLDTDKLEAYAIDIAAFANAYGGSILFGIGEKEGEAAGFSGQVTGDAVSRFLNTTVRDLLSPDIKFDTVDFKVDGNIVVSVNVPPSIGLAGACINRDRKGYCFPYRTEHGNRFYTYSELERLMATSESRAKFLKVLEYLKGKGMAEVTLYPGIGKIRPKRITLSVLPGNVSEFEICVNSMDTIRLPYSMIIEIWNRTNVGEELCVQLSERIYKHGETGPLDIVFDTDKIPAKDSTFKGVSRPRKFRSNGYT